MCPFSWRGIAHTFLLPILLAIPTKCFLQHAPITFRTPQASLLSARVGTGTITSPASAASVPFPPGVATNERLRRCARSRSHARRLSRLAMTFDFSQMVDQFMESLTTTFMGNGKGTNKGSGDSKVVYDVAVVGYGPAGGVMVRAYSYCLG